MNSKVLCFNHAKELIDGLFVGQRVVFDTNLIPRTQSCEYSHDLIPNSQCRGIGAVIATVLGRGEPYLHPRYLQDIQPKTSPQTAQSKL